MIAHQEWIEICKILKNHSVPEAARIIGRSPATIYRLLKTGGPQKYDDSPGNTFNTIIPFKNFIEKRQKTGLSNFNKLFSELEEKGYQGSYTTLLRYINTQDISEGTDDNKPSIRFETEPGEQAQVDWGSCGSLKIDAREIRIYCFAYILGYSRAMYAEFTTRQNVENLLQCHINAFKALGIPKTIVYDNTKTVVLSREKRPDNSEKIHYNPNLLDFSKCYGFEIILCHPYWPRSKGKVESAIKYIKNNFLSGQKISSLEEINYQMQVWLKSIANNRIHGTTKKKPFDQWEMEKKYLRFPHDLPKYIIKPCAVRNSTREGLIQYKSNLYPVPSEYARKKLFVREVNENGRDYIEILHEDETLVKYELCRDAGQLVEEGHYLTLPQLSHQENSSAIQTSSPQSIKQKFWTIPSEPLTLYDALLKHE